MRYYGPARDVLRWIAWVEGNADRNGFTIDAFRAEISQAWKRWDAQSKEAP